MNKEVRLQRYRHLLICNTFFNKTFHKKRWGLIMFFFLSVSLYLSISLNIFCFFLSLSLSLSLSFSLSVIKNLFLIFNLYFFHLFIWDSWSNYLNTNLMGSKDFDGASLIYLVIYYPHYVWLVGQQLFCLMDVWRFFSNNVF